MTTNKTSQITWNIFAIVSLVLGLLSLPLIYVSAVFLYVSWELSDVSPMLVAFFAFILAGNSGVPALLTGIIAVTHYNKCNKVGKISAIAGLVIGSLT